MGSKGRKNVKKPKQTGGSIIEQNPLKLPIVGWGSKC